MASKIEGDWNATGACCYTATWKVSVVDEENIIVKEQPGAKCLGGIPNCILKESKMKKTSEGTYKGTSGFKPISLEVRSDNELYHVTTDGPRVMKRD